MELYEIHAIVSFIKLVFFIEQMGVNLAANLRFQLFVRFIAQEMGVLRSRTHERISLHPFLSCKGNLVL